MSNETIDVYCFLVNFILLSRAPYTFTFCCRKKEQMQQMLRDDVNENLLFHGTKRRFIDDTCKGNFDWSIAGTNGTFYGKGKNITE